MRNTDLVIFDLDGTLADTSEGILNSIRYVQKKMGLSEITMEQMFSHIGPPMEESYNRNFGLTGDRLRLAVTYHKEYAVNQGYKELRLYSGVEEFIRRLREMGVKTAVATLKAQSTADRIFECLGLSDSFDEVIGTDLSEPMTKAQMIVAVLERVGVSGHRSVLIGDSSYDAAGAAEAGVPFVAVTYGYGFKSDAEAQSFCPEKVCGSVQELTKYFCG